jgi:hypothetical protein
MGRIEGSASVEIGAPIAVAFAAAADVEAHAGLADESARGRGPRA